MWANRPVSALAETTTETWPRSIRSARSAGRSSVLAGITTAPIFAAASMISQSGTVLPRNSRIRSPLRTRCSRSQPATWDERRDISAKLTCVSPSAVTSHRAGWCGRSAASTPSNQSIAQLNSPVSGQRNPAYAACGSSRWVSRKSRAARNASVAVTRSPCHAAAIGATVAFATRTRSSGASETCRPRRPALT